MLNLENLKIRPFVDDLREACKRNYGHRERDVADIAAWTGSLALENIANTDALYHNIDHTIMVTLVGQEIIRGKHLIEGGVSPKDWLHFILALLCHDIGYVKGVCTHDGNGVYATGIDGKTVKIPAGGTDAALTPYHVDRSKLFIRERFDKHPLIDAELVASYIEGTRFPIPEEVSPGSATEFSGLARASDFIGQLGDPSYLRKIPALFYEFKELGTDQEMGYKDPGDMRKTYPKFFWNVVSPYIQLGLWYLRVTQEGKQWIANLNSHVFSVEHANP